MIESFISQISHKFSNQIRESSRSFHETVVLHRHNEVELKTSHPYVNQKMCVINN